jgi:hypothetical protein
VSGATLLGLTLVSMGWLFFVAGAAINFTAWRRARKSGEHFAGLPLLPGLIGSVTAFFSAGALLSDGWPVPWPWLWILLPLVLDLGCLGRWVLALAGLRAGPRRDG